MKYKRLPKLARERLHQLLKVTDPVSAFSGSESARDFFIDEGWNACIRRMLRIGRFPRRKKQKGTTEQTTEQWTRAAGWNEAVGRLSKMKW